jgi:hypothetical protein
MGAQFEQSARMTPNELLQGEFQQTGTRLLEMGIARL